MAVVSPSGTGAPLVLVVTGATGFVGRALVRRAEREPGTRIRCLVRRAVEPPPTGSVSFHQGSLEDVPDDLFPDTPYILVHLATEQHSPGRSGFVGTNMRNARSLIGRMPEGCLGIVSTSSLSVLGQGPQVGVDESAAAAPTTELAKARAMVERLLAETGERRGFSVFTARTRFIFGAGDTQTLPGLHRFMKSGLIPGTGAQRFSIIDVGDYADLLVRLAARCAERQRLGDPVRTPVHVGYRRPISLREIRLVLVEQVGGLPAMAVPVPVVLRHLAATPVLGRRLEGAMQRLALFGLPHWMRVNRLAAELGAVGREIVERDPRQVVRAAALALAADGGEKAR